MTTKTKTRKSPQQKQQKRPQPASKQAKRSKARPQQQTTRGDGAKRKGGVHVSPPQNRQNGALNRRERLKTIRDARKRRRELEGAAEAKREPLNGTTVPPAEASQSLPYGDPLNPPVPPTKKEKPPKKRNYVVTISSKKKMTTANWKKDGKPVWWLRIGKGRHVKFLEIPAIPGNEPFKVEIDLRAADVAEDSHLYYGVGAAQLGVRGNYLTPEKYDAPPKPPKVDNSKLNWSEPVFEAGDLSKWHVWWSECGRYRIVRSISNCGMDPQFAATEGKKHIIRTDMKSLQQAVYVVSNYHKAKYDQEFVTGNEVEVVSKAMAEGLNTLPTLEEITEKPQKKRREVELDAEGNPVPKPVREPKQSKETNYFGHRLGTRAVRLDDALSKKPQTMAEINKRANYDKPCHGHLNDLIKRGLLAKTDDKKYYLTKEGLELKGATNGQNDAGDNTGGTDGVRGDVGGVVDAEEHDGGRKGTRKGKAARGKGRGRRTDKAGGKAEKRKGKQPKRKVSK